MEPEVGGVGLTMWCPRGEDDEPWHPVPSV